MPAVQQGDLSPLLNPCETHLKNRVLFLAYEYKRDRSAEERIQQRATKVIKGLEHLLWRKGNESGNDSAQKKMSQEDLFNTYKVLIKVIVPTGRTSGDAYKSKPRKFHLYIRKNFSTMSVIKHGKRISKQNMEVTNVGDPA